MIRAKTIPQEELRNLINALHQLQGISKRIQIGEFSIDATSDRYENFYYHGWKCAECGLEATFAAIEKHPKDKGYHINLYGFNENGREIMLTRDHIYPKSLGGLNAMSNSQTLCACCNQKKLDTTELSIEEAVANGYTTYELATHSHQLKEDKRILASLTEQVEELKKKINRDTQMINTLRNKTSIDFNKNK